MATRVTINGPALVTWLETNPGAQRGLAVTAGAVKNAVVEASPVGVSLSWPWRRPMRHGLFKKSIVAEKAAAGWRVVSYDYFGAMIEWGTVNNPPYAPFRRVLRMFRGVGRAAQP